VKAGLHGAACPDEALRQRSKCAARRQKQKQRKGKQRDLTQRTGVCHAALGLISDKVHPDPIPHVAECNNTEKAPKHSPLGSTVAHHTQGGRLRL